MTEKGTEGERRRVSSAQASLLGLSPLLPFDSMVGGGLELGQPCLLTRYPVASQTG